MKNNLRIERLSHKMKLMRATYNDVQPDDLGCDIL